MVPVMEAVPNFSEGRDLGFLDAIVETARREGVDVLDGSADADHHRAVVTWVGDPTSVERAAAAVARVALERVDLREHRGVHPRVGALDVMPLVPLLGVTMNDAVASAHRVARAVAALGIPVHVYGAASNPPGRQLSEIRRGGFEAYRSAFPPDRRPAYTAGRSAGHPTAGITCVGARPLLLAWNVLLQGLTHDQVRAIAARLREQGGGFAGLRALGLDLGRHGILQLSMNLEDVERRDPMVIFEAIEAETEALGGRILGTEVIGMIPAPLVLGAATRRLSLLDVNSSRFLPTRLTEHLAARAERDVDTVRAWLDELGDPVPDAVRVALERLSGRTSGDDG